MNAKLVAARLCHVIAVWLVAGSLISCSSSMNTQDSRMAKVQELAQNGSESPKTPGPTVLGERYDPSTEQEISDTELKAWRVAIAHKNQGQMSDEEWKKTRIKDEAEAMRQLEELAAKYPKASFIKTMMGQVKHHFGKESEAAKYYEEALAQNRHDPLITFKLAEARRLSGEHAKAVQYYRETLELQPDFTEARLGLAKVLLQQDNNDSEAKGILEDILKSDPGNKEALALNSPKTSAQ